MKKVVLTMTFAILLRTSWQGANFFTIGFGIFEEIQNTQLYCGISEHYRNSFCSKWALQHGEMPVQI